MLLKSLTKNPILMIGILMMAIFLMGLAKKGYFSDSDRFNPTSCKAVRVKLDKRIPANWKTNCNKNNLHVVIHLFPDEEINKLEEKSFKKYMYKTLANNMSLTAENSPEDNLERTDIVSFRLIHKKMTLNATTDGKYIVKLITLKSPELIAEHLKNTVNVQEVVKE